MAAGGGGVSVPAVPYTTNLFAHWDAARTDTISHTGGLVDTWNDLVAGRDLNGVTTTRPTTGATTLNGFNILDFDDGGNPHYLTDAGTAADFAFMHNGASSTVYLVCHIGITGSPATDYGLYGNNAGTSSNIGHYLLFLGNGAPVNRSQHVVTRGVGGSFVTINQSADNYLPGDTWVLIEVVTDSDAATADRSKVYVANSSVVQNNASTATDSNSNPTYAWQIGALGNNTNTGVLKVAEILIYSEEVTGTNRTDVRDYLGDKWAVTV